MDLNEYKIQLTLGTLSNINLVDNLIPKITDPKILEYIATYIILKLEKCTDLPQVKNVEVFKDLSIMMGIITVFIELLKNANLYKRTRTKLDTQLKMGAPWLFDHTKSNDF